MKVFFILGREPALSATEGLAVLKHSDVEVVTKSLSREVLIVETKKELDSAKLMESLGGTIKVGLVLNEFRQIPLQSELERIIGELITEATSGAPQIVYGFSAYDAGGMRPRDLSEFQHMLMKVGIAVKRDLKSGERKVRYVTSREPTLSSVVVDTNKLTRTGVELVFLLGSNGLNIGRTTAVQPFRELAKRDFGRPGRDAKSGMLPPKLARMIVNLSETPIDGTILDPFCGSGTVLMESWLMGYQTLIGSDIDSTAVANTRENLDWLDARALDNSTLFDQGIAHVPSSIASHSIDGIATEPFLGPPLHGNETYNDIIQIEKQLHPLFVTMLASFKKMLKPGAKAVVTFPLWRIQNSFVHASILSEVGAHGFKLHEPLPRNIIPQGFSEELGPRGDTLIYGRDNQRVWREIAILEMK